MSQQKLSKDQIQKIALSVVGFIALIYVYLNFFLAPLAKSRAVMEKTIADLHVKIDASKSEIPKATNLERQASNATSHYAALQALTPEGAPIAWFPPRVKVFFANEGIDKVTTKLDSNAPFPQKELSGWARYVWQIDLPQTDYATAGKAVADLENAEPLLSVTRLSIRGTGDNPEFQQVALAVSSAILKR
ncbi:MAG TPA: hypothetical protein VGC85_03845 [Chthoniobacterales bacterium]